MATKDRYFPTQEVGEKIFLLIRRHWVVFATLAFFIFIMSLPLIALGVYWLISPEVFAGNLGNFIIIFASVYALIILGLCLYGFVNYYLDVYIITNERLVDIKQNGFFRREIAEVHFRQVQDVEAKVEGFLGTMLHYGNVYIQTAGERENFVLEDIPHPYTISKKIAELHQKQVRSSQVARTEYKDSANSASKVDDYRVEDYKPYIAEQQKNNNEIESQHKMVSSVEEVPEKEPNKEKQIYEKPLEETGFGADNQDVIAEKKLDQELRQMSEGEEVKLDDYD